MVAVYVHKLVILCAKYDQPPSFLLPPQRKNTSSKKHREICKSGWFLIFFVFHNLSGLWKKMELEKMAVSAKMERKYLSAVKSQGEKLFDSEECKVLRH